MIPKKIHYCWFGRGKKSELIEKCMATWKKVLPEYEVKEWNEDNFDLSSVQYVREAYKERKWAFVTDYVRLYALYHEGGIYMDTDVEVLKPIDRFLSLPAFSGYQDADQCLTGIMGSEKGGEWVKDMLDDYIGRSFYRENGEINETTNVEYTTYLMRTKKGMKIDGNLESLEGYVTFFPVDFFCPKICQTDEVNLTENTYTIHHFAGSWLGRRRLFSRTIRRHLGQRAAYYFAYFTRRPDKVIKSLTLAFRRRWARLTGKPFKEPERDPIQKFQI